MMIEHLSRGNVICETCGEPAHKHRKSRKRIRHASVGDTCRKCGEPRAKHPSRTKIRERRKYDKARPNRQAEKKFVGIDGEGYDTDDGRHLYVYLAAVDETGKTIGEAYNPEGLSHEQCVSMLLAIPRENLCFWFGGGYDSAKIFEALPAEDIYAIMHPSTRVVQLADGKTARKHHVIGDRSYDWFNGAVTLREGKNIALRKKKGRMRKTVVWRRQTTIYESFKFFLTSFVKALGKWNVGTEEQRARIKAMKDLRGSIEFKTDAERMKAYCREECSLLAVLMRQVIEAHEKAKVPLERYDGAGSTATAILKRENVLEYAGPLFTEYAAELRHAIMAAQFGGRFELSTAGLVERPLWNRDVGAAYPYAQSTNLPCLKCGRWRKVEGAETLRAIERASAAVGQFEVLPVVHRERYAWGPLPCRDKKGSLVFPFNFKGWAWGPELLEAIALYPDLVVVKGAWIYETSCSHRPFRAWPKYYRYRCELSKDGAGIVVKNGQNATAGKTMQHVGTAPFQNFIWSGLTTATTRGQLLAGIRAARDPWNVISVATDGLVTSEDLTLPRPKDTGTYDLEKPLGSWDTKYIEEGGFFASPGRFFRLKGIDDPKDVTALEDTRARGLGRVEMHKNRAALIACFRAWDRVNPDHKFQIVSRRFYGARSSILMFSKCTRCSEHWSGPAKLCCPECGRVGDYTKPVVLDAPDKMPAYGRWFERKFNVSFRASPKREAFLDLTSPHSRLLVPDAGGIESVLFNPGKTTPEGQAQRDGRVIDEEDPNIGEDNLFDPEEEVA